MRFVVTVFLYAFNNFLIRLTNDKDELIDKLLIKMGYSDDKKNIKKIEMNKWSKNEEKEFSMFDSVFYFIRPHLWK